MIHFNELKIINNQLVIDVSVLNESYYTNVYIDSIVIDNGDTYTPNGPSSNPVYSYTVPDEYSRLRKKFFSKKNVRLVLSPSELGGTLKGLFFVYVRTKGIPAPDTPCGMDNMTTMGTVVDMYPFYQQAMQYIKEVGSNCTIPQSFTDYIQKLKAIELDIRTGNYTEAINHYNRFFGDSKTTYNTVGGCGCGNH